MRWYESRNNLNELMEWLDSRDQLMDHDPYFLISKPERYEEDWQQFQNATNALGASHGMDSSTSALLDAGESPVIRALPVTDKIVPLNWVSGALPEMQRTH